MSGSTQAGFTGDGSNMRNGTAGGKAFLVDHLWWAHVGATKGGRPVMEPVKGCLDEQPGRFDDGFRGPLSIPESFTGLAQPAR